MKIFPTPAAGAPLLEERCPWTGRAPTGARLTRALLEYRYRRLPHARMAARAAGLAGAMFPWQSGSSGREEAQSLHLNPRSGHWIRDHTQLQRHINIAVAYNVWLYYQVTGDLDFLSFYGAELILEITRFLGRPGPLRQLRRPLRDQGRHGARRVPCRVPGREGAGPCQQRLHQHHGRLALLPGPGDAGAAAGGASADYL